jgi:hypothetical protein
MLGFLKEVLGCDQDSHSNYGIYLIMPLIAHFRIGIETATFANQTPEEISRLLHMVVVGGGPTGIEFAAELQDFFLKKI